MKIEKQKKKYMLKLLDSINIIFEELYQHFDKVSIGYNKKEEANPNDMELYYSKQEQSKYGVLGIEIKLTNLYKIIKNDKYIIDIYNQIEQAEYANKGWAHHNYIHAINVTKTIKQLLKELKYEQELIESAMIAGILHDIGALEGKEGHAIRSYEKAKKYFTDNKLEFKYQKRVLEAIKNHSYGFDTEDIITLALILADKLDIKKTRVCSGGHEAEGMRQLAYIEDIIISITNNILTINFIVDTNINLAELNNFYFTKKVFKAIEMFATKLNLNYKILINTKSWTLE